jgi:hypothetical protein
MKLRLDYVFFGTLGLISGAIIFGRIPPVSVLAAQSGQETLSVRKINIVGADGKTRATIAVEDDGSADLVFYDANGTRRIGLGTSGSKKKRGGAALNLFDSSGKTIRNRLYVRDSDGSTGLTLNDRLGQPRAGLAINASGTPASP